MYTLMGDDAMGMVLLGCAIAAEIVATTCMRMTLESEWWRVPAYVLYALAFSLFPWILETVALTAAYATWSAAGSVGVALVGQWVFGDELKVRNWLGVCMVSIGAVLVYL